SAQELLRKVRHCACTPLVLPQARAVVSNTRSKRNSGLLYGFLAEERPSVALCCFSVRSLGVIASEAFAGAYFPEQWCISQLEGVYYSDCAKCHFMLPEKVPWRGT